MTHWEANKLMLASGTLNMVLPSKMGDMAKAFFMSKRGKMSRPLALSCVVFEKGCDMLSLLLWCLIGLLLYPEKAALYRNIDPQMPLAPGTSLAMYWATVALIAALLLKGSFILGSTAIARTFFKYLGKISPRKLRPKFENLAFSWSEMHNYFWQHKGRLAAVVVISLFLWFLHLLQIWLFVIALRQQAPIEVSYALAPLAILAGLLPFTLAGVGTRDAALIYFYSPYMPEAAAVALGLLCTARYILPALGGLPFMTDYLHKIREYNTAEPSQL
jgi:uncharacterized protein (TIRG00374 family)